MAQPPNNEGSALQSLARRLMGVLPHIDIAGVDFTIDWRLRELRETAVPWNKINLDELRESESGEEYLGLYDTRERRLHEFDPDMISLPENVVGIEIPNEIKLDPVAVAREYGIDVNEFLERHPMQNNLKALVRPISETGLPELVVANLSKSQSNEFRKQRR